MIKAVIIDLDDTLCLTEAACFELENDVLKQMGRQPMSRNIHLSTWGRPLFEALSDRSPGLDVAEFKRFYRPAIDKYIQAGKLDKISAENYRTMDALLELNKHLFVLTSRTHEELFHMLEPDHQLAKKVTAFYCRDNMEFHKPDPRAFDKLLDENDLTQDECVYIGDSVGDAVAAKDAGLHFIASLESGLRTKSDFSGISVDRFIEKFSDLLGVIQGLE